MMWFEARWEIISDLQDAGVINARDKVMSWFDLKDEDKQSFEEHMDNLFGQWVSFKMSQTKDSYIYCMAVICIAYNDTDKFWSEARKNKNLTKYKEKLVQNAIDELRKPNLKVIQGGKSIEKQEWYPSI